MARTVGRTPFTVDEEFAINPHNSLIVYDLTSIRRNSCIRPLFRRPKRQVLVFTRQIVHNIRAITSGNLWKVHNMADRPLANIIVLDLTHMLSGPFATMVLADLGAETIKIEPPGRGEATRQLLADPAHSGNRTAPFLTLNRGKKSIAIDLKRPEGREVFYRLVRTADVVVDNFSPASRRASVWITPP